MTSAETIVRNVTERPDSLTIGTPGKGGEVKFYFDALNLEDAKLRATNAFIIRALAGDLQEVKTAPPKTLSEAMNKVEEISPQ